MGSSGSVAAEPAVIIPQRTEKVSKSPSVFEEDAFWFDGSHFVTRKIVLCQNKMLYVMHHKQKTKFNLSEVKKFSIQRESIRSTCLDALKDEQRWERVVTIGVRETYDSIHFCMKDDESFRKFTSALAEILRTEVDDPTPIPITPPFEPSENKKPQPTLGNVIMVESTPHGKQNEPTPQIESTKGSISQDINQVEDQDGEPASENIIVVTLKTNEKKKLESKLTPQIESTTALIPQESHQSHLPKPSPAIKNVIIVEPKKRKTRKVEKLTEVGS